MLHDHFRRKFLIASYSVIVRRGLASVVGDIVPDAAIVEASCFDEAKKRLECEIFFAAIFDIDPEDQLRSSNFQEIRVCHPHLIVGVLSHRDDASTILSHLAAGVNGYILGCSSSAEIESAVEGILRGAIYVPPSLVRSKASQLAPHFDGPLRYAKPKELTGRQSDVLRLLLNGFSNKEIARELNVSPHTVKIHVGALLRHFAVERRTDLPVAASRSHRNGTHPTSFSQPEDTPRASLLIDAE